MGGVGVGVETIIPVPVISCNSFVDEHLVHKKVIHYVFINLFID
jgi:hypothetical protein